MEQGIAILKPCLQHPLLLAETTSTVFQGIKAMVPTELGQGEEGRKQG